MLRMLADLCSAQGAALLEEGSPGTAQTLLALAVRLAPSNPRFHYQAAQAASALGERDKAARYCERALALDPSFAPADELLMNVFLHGEHYLGVLERIHRLLRPRTYLEIGVAEGQSIRLASPQTIAIGVDPEPPPGPGLPPNVRLFAQTSDEFFAQNDVRALLEGLPLDLAFIDGLHHFEFALRDFVNLERFCRRGSTLLIHDCFPHDRRTAQRERVTQFWSGDVWRLIVLLKKYRPDLSICTIATPPTGLGVVRNLDPASRLLGDNIERLTAEFLSLDYGFLEKDRADRLSLFPNDWSRIEDLLARTL